jgi:hypothetical protein
VSRIQEGKQKEFYLVECNAMPFHDKIQPTFRRNILPPSSGSKNKPSKNQRETGSKQSEIGRCLLQGGLTVGLFSERDYQIRVLANGGNHNRHVGKLVEYIRFKFHFAPTQDALPYPRNGLDQPCPTRRPRYTFLAPSVSTLFEPIININSNSKTKNFLEYLSTVKYFHIIIIIIISSSSSSRSSSSSSSSVVAPAPP